MGYTGYMCVCARLCAKYVLIDSTCRSVRLCVCVGVCLSVCVYRHTCDALLQVFVEGTRADLQEEGRVEPLESFNPSQPGQNDVHII